MYAWPDDAPINLYATVREIEAPAFGAAGVDGRNRQDPDLSGHLDGFCGFVMQDGRMDQRRYHLLQHIGRTQHHYALRIAASSRAALADWMNRANAVAFLPDMTVRDAAGRVLFSPDSAQEDADAHAPRPADAVARRAASASMLSGMGLPPVTVLPPVISETEADLRPAAEVARRALALTAVAARGESLLNGQPLSAKDLRQRLPAAMAALTPAEQELMRDGGFLGLGKRPDRQTAVQACWRYEAAATLLWSLGVLADLPGYEATVDAADLTRRVLDLPANFAETARSRPVAEILDELDRVYRLHWLATEARLGRSPAPGIDAGVVLERHYALNWLTRFEDAEWDDISTPT